MDETQIKAVSVSRRSAFWHVSRILYGLLIIGAVGILVVHIKPKADPAIDNNQDAKVLRFDVFGPLGSLDPRPGEGGDAPLVMNFIYSYLFIMDEEGQLEPDLASWWSYDNESFTWTIRLRDGTQFHDGSPVTASDVVYSLRTALEAILPSESQYLNRLTAKTDQVLEICLKRDDPLFLEKIWSFEILKQPGENAANYSSHPIGSGPFKFDYRIANTEVGLTANEHYYRGRPRIDKVVFYHQPDKERSWARLLAGKTDIARGIEAQDYRMIEHYGDKFYFKTTIEPYLIMLLYNVADGDLGDPRVRMALSRAIDKQYIVRVILRGMGVVPPGSMGYYSSLRGSGLKPIPYDPSESIRLLGEAGWAYDPQSLYLQKGGKTFELTILFFEENRLHESIARCIQLCLHDVGIKVHIEPVPFDELIQRYWRKVDFQAVLAVIPDIRDGLNPVLDYWQYFLNRNGPEGGSSLDPRISALADQIRLEADGSRRKALWGELNSLLDSSLPATSLVQRTSLDVLSRRFVAPCDLSNMYYRFKLWQVSPVSQ